MTEGPVMPPLIGRRLGDYTIEAIVGRGGWPRSTGRATSGSGGPWR